MANIREETDNAQEEFLDIYIQIKNSPATTECKDTY